MLLFGRHPKANGSVTKPNTTNRCQNLQHIVLVTNTRMMTHISFQQRALTVQDVSLHQRLKTTFILKDNVSPFLSLLTNMYQQLLVLALICSQVSLETLCPVSQSHGNKSSQLLIQEAAQLQEYLNKDHRHIRTQIYNRSSNRVTSFTSTRLDNETTNLNRHQSDRNSSTREKLRVCFQEKKDFDKARL